MERTLWRSLMTWWYLRFTLVQWPKATSLELAINKFDTQHCEHPWSDTLLLESRKELGNSLLLQVTFTLISSMQIQLHFSLSLQSTVKAKLSAWKYTFLTLDWNIFCFSVGRTALLTGAIEETSSLLLSSRCTASALSKSHSAYSSTSQLWVISAPQEKGRPVRFSETKEYLLKLFAF